MIVNPAGRCTTSTSSGRPENRVQHDDEGIKQIDVNNGHKMIVVNNGHRIDVNSTKSVFHRAVSEAIVTGSSSIEEPRHEDRPENRVQDVDEGIGQIDVNNRFLGTSSEIDDDGQIDLKSEYQTMMKESGRSF
ncbi:unnamed protein product [Camellia sinensis]